MRKIICLMICILMMTTLLVGCGQEGAAPPDEGAAADANEPLKMGFIVGSFEHVFYQLIAEGIEAKAEELGIEAIVVDAQLDASVATDQIQNLSAQGCVAIALSCNDAAGVVPGIEAADADGVAMFTFDCTCDSPVIHSFVGTDNFEGGRLGGQELIRLTEEGDNVAIIGYPTASSVLDRENGAKEVLEGSGRNLKFVGDYAGDATKAQQLMQDWLTQDPDLAAVFCGGDPAATGALAAIKSAGADTKIIGFDGNPEAIEAILDTEGNGKWWVSEISQNPNEIGGKIVEQMYKYMTEGKVDAKSIFIPPYIITKENAAQ
ncbi:MAG: substrate-binding domain-containing protein [Clostridia bacterium]|nr:substrate-binding domain-containing protein [Clostridia bacterium]